MKRGVFLSPVTRCVLAAVCIFPVFLALSAQGADPHYSLQFNSPVSGTTITDDQGKSIWQVNDPTQTVPAGGYFRGDGVNNYLRLTSDPDMFTVTSRLTLEARIKPAVMGRGTETTIQRLFAHDGGGNYQMSVWRNPAVENYHPPDGVGSIAFWVSPQDKHGGNTWKPVLTDYGVCPIVANHWYQVKVVWNSEKTGGIPADILIDDQGAAGDNVGEQWAGAVNCTDADQSQLPTAMHLFEGDRITPASGIVVIGANVNDQTKNLFVGQIDWIDWQGDSVFHQAGSYYPGFTWSVPQDYNQGTVRNSTAGNPDDDANGNPTWTYEWIDVNNLDADPPWYLNKTNLLTWDSYIYNRNTWGTPYSIGTVNLDGSSMNFHYSAAAIGEVPLVRWTNPTNGPARIDITGRITLSWWGLNVNPNRASKDYWDYSYLVGSPADIDLVLGLHDASTNTVQVLYSKRLEKPHDEETTCVPPNYGDCDHVDVDLDMQVDVENGDSIFWSARAVEYSTAANRWITLNYGQVKLTLASEPETEIPGPAAVIDPGKFYIVEPDSAITRLASIDPDTLDVETVLDLTGVTGFRSNSLAFSPDGRLFGWDNLRSQLFRIDLETGRVLHIGLPEPDWQGINGLAFDRAGNLYGVHGGVDQLVSIDPSTGMVSVVGDLGVDAGHTGLAIDFIADMLYGVSGYGEAADFLMKIDREGPVSGLGEIIGPLGYDGGAVGVEFSPLTGELFAVRENNRFVKVDLESGLATELGVLVGALSTSLAAPWPSVSAIDGDRDGYTSDEGDCNDANAAIKPGASEIPYDGVDQNCDGVDLVDVDDDGYVGQQAGGNDCNDSNAAIKPGATEIPYDGTDQNCDGVDLVDVDGDGYVGKQAGGNDCNDANASINPGAKEVYGNGIDDDCNPNTAETVLVNIDIRPGPGKNNINVKASGMVPVAILGSKTFNASAVDWQTVRFASAPPVAQGNVAKSKDVNKDGYPDMELTFDNAILNIRAGDTSACLTGRTVTGIEFSGCDTVTAFANGNTVTAKGK